jgi:stress-induced morphogen
VDRHRLVNAVLADELKERVHALAIEASAPDR